jgi:hypothetical protein
LSNFGIAPLAFPQILLLLLLLQVGVCPQFDMLWGELTGLEHLVVAGHVKGLPFSEVSTHVLLSLWFCRCATSLLMSLMMRLGTSVAHAL